jgi:hypothetical protein
MAGNLVERRGRGGRWLLLAVVLAVIAWIVRSQRAAAAADVGTGWPPARPPGAGVDWPLPQPSSAPTPAPVTSAPVPAAPVRSPAPASAMPPAAGSSTPAGSRPEPAPATAAAPGRATPAPVDRPASGGAAPATAPARTPVADAWFEPGSRRPSPAPHAAATPATPVDGAVQEPPARRPSPRPRSTPPAATPAGGLPRGAATPLPDGSAPGPEYTIKGNAGSMLFHPPTSPYFGRTKAEYWFRTAEDARAAGFSEWSSGRR